MQRSPAFGRRTTRLAVAGSALALVATALPAAGAARPSGQVYAAATTTALATPTAHHLAGDLGPATGAPRAWATRTLRTRAGALGVRADAFRLEVVQRTPIGTAVRGRQYVGDTPVAGTDVLVYAIHGRVAQVDAHTLSLPGHPAASPVGAAVARTAALGRLDISTLLSPAHVERVLTPVAGRLVDTYQVSVVGRVPARAARVDVDAATGRVRRVTDAASYDVDPARRATASVKARIFDPNPVVTSHNTRLRSPFETGTGVDVPLDSAALTKQLKVRTLQGLNPTRLRLGILSGTWVDVTAPVGYVNPLGGTLSYSRSDPRFVGLMAYAHIDRYQRWLRSLGLTHVNNEAQRVVPTLAEGYDNSFYQPGNDLIVYGGGGVPDAEDAEVILHEYGHAMQDAQVPGYGATTQGGSMGEGFGDFNAANYFALTSKGFGDRCVAEWDATSYSTTNPPCLRRTDSTKRYPKDVEGEVHADGEMWSAYLWRLRGHLGTTARTRSVNAIRLVLTMHTLLTPNASYADAVAGLRTAANALHHPRWATFAIAEARKTGYPVRS